MLQTTNKKSPSQLWQRVRFAAHRTFPTRLFQAAVFGVAAFIAAAAYCCGVLAMKAVTITTIVTLIAFVGVVLVEFVVEFWRSKRSMRQDREERLSEIGPTLRRFIEHARSLQQTLKEERDRMQRFEEATEREHLMPLNPRQERSYDIELCKLEGEVTAFVERGEIEEVLGLPPGRFIEAKPTVEQAVVVGVSKPRLYGLTEAKSVIYARAQLLERWLSVIENAWNERELGNFPNGGDKVFTLPKL